MRQQSAKQGAKPLRIALCCAGAFGRYMPRRHPRMQSNTRLDVAAAPMALSEAAQHTIEMVCWK